MRARLASRLKSARLQRRQWNASVHQRVMTGFPILQWMTVGVYRSQKGGINPRGVLRKLEEHGATIAWPVTADDNTLRFCQWHSGTPGSRRPLLPAAENAARNVHPQALLVPIVGFDEQGYRLGDGTGDLDRTLAKLSPRPLTIGVAYEASRIWTIHPQAHDIPMDFIVTEAGTYHAEGGALHALEHAQATMELAGELIQLRGRTVAFTQERREYASPVCFMDDPASRFDPF